MKDEGTAPEKAPRALLESMGLGEWRYSDSSQPGSPDAYHPGRRIAIFLDGCYWHGHSCRPPSRWSPNVEKNRERDKRINEELSKRGIKVVRIWECILLKYPGRVLELIMDSL